MGSGPPLPSLVGQCRRGTMSDGQALIYMPYYQETRYDLELCLALRSRARPLSFVDQCMITCTSCILRKSMSSACVAGGSCGRAEPIYSDRNMKIILSCLTDRHDSEAVIYS